MQPVSDHRSNPNEQIESAVKAIGMSSQRLEVFKAIYKGKKKRKTVTEIEKATGLSKVRVLQCGGHLVGNGIATQEKVDGELCYVKDQFISTNKQKILRIVADPKKLEKLPTKSRSTLNVSHNLSISVPRAIVRARQVTIDDIDSFNNVKTIGTNIGARRYTKILENDFKGGIKRILGARSTFKDWGGETNDLLTTRVTLKGNRISTAFAFKGRGKTGKLTPAKMGKNGDQIQRLFQSPADLYIVQYWGEVDQSVIDQVQSFAQLTSVVEVST